MNATPPLSMQHLFLESAAVGSRVTCNPPPTDTDIDVLCLIDVENYGQLELLRQFEGFIFDGSEIKNEHGSHCFASYSRRSDGMNLIVTDDPKFYWDFLAATSIAKRFNLMDKADRIALFQAVLYGNPCES